MKYFLKLFLYNLFLYFIILGCTNRQYPLHNAVLYEDISKIKIILESGYDINKLDNRGRTALYIASLEGSKEVVEYLLSKGANIEKGASWKGYKRPLHNAAEKGHGNIVELLISKGAKINVKDSSGSTPLHYAISNRNIDIVKFLLEKGADINISDNYGYTPLIEASRICSKEIIEMLISKGADTDMISKEGRKATSYAQECD